MDRDNLIKMANQIGAFFEAMPDQVQAVADVANHLRRTWDPRMLAEILKSLGTAEEARLKPVVRDAVKSLAQVDAS